MLDKTTLNQLHELRLSAMAAKLVQMREQPELASLSFDESFAILVQAEWISKRSKRINRFISNAGFRFPAVIEDIDYSGKKGLSKPEVLRLSEGLYLRKKQNIFVCGPTGVGKTYLACALGRSACSQGSQALYIRIPDFFIRLADAQMEGRFASLRKKLSAVPLLILDDWGLRKFTLEETHEIMELFERRYDCASTIIVSQLPSLVWHELFPDPTLADAILDRVVHNAHKLNISGESMRKTLASRDAD
jgi:DNA replication protein DnaC